MLQFRIQLYIIQSRLPRTSNREQHNEEGMSKESIKLRAQLNSEQIGLQRWDCKRAARRKQRALSDQLRSGRRRTLKKMEAWKKNRRARLEGKLGQE